MRSFESCATRIRAGLGLLLCAALTACGGGDDTPAVPDAVTFLVGGTVTGLEPGTSFEAGTVLAGTTALARARIDSNGRYSLRLAAGTAYDIRILAQPEGQTCTVANGVGTASADSDAISIACAPAAAPAVPAALTVTYGIKGYSFAWGAVPLARTYRVLEDPDGVSGFTEVAGAAGTTATHAIGALLHRRLNARYAVQACNDVGCSPASPAIAPDPVRAIGYFKASNPASGDRFGGAVALSADGSTLAVGAINEDSSSTGIDGAQDEGASQSGAVYIFARTASGWRQQAFVKPHNTGAGDAFGISLALSADGGTLAVGAYFEDSEATGINAPGTDNLKADSGAAYVFVRDGATWTQQAYIKASNARAGDYFGYALSLSADGNSLAVGAYRESASTSGVDAPTGDYFATRSGAAYLFTRSGTAWTQSTYFKASNPRNDDRFGWSVALSGDGATLAVGAYFQDGSAAGVNGDEGAMGRINAGAVYVFSRSAGTWAQQAYVKAPYPDASDQFGYAVALSHDGNTLAAGAHFEQGSATGVNGDGTNNGALQAGAAFVFTRAAGVWSQQAYLKASNTAAFTWFGSALSLSADGNTLAVGSRNEFSNATGFDGNGANTDMAFSGAVYVFARTGTSWAQSAYVKAPNTGGGDAFGYSVSLSADGRALAVGAAQESSGSTDPADDLASEAGAVYLY